MQRFFIGLFIALSVCACGTSRKASTKAPVMLPLEDPAAIAQSQARAQAVLDSIDRVKSEPKAETPVPEVGSPATGTPPANTPQSLADEVIAYARTFTGTPYRLGASGPKEFDCSSFTSYVFRHFGITITPYSQTQYKEGREVPSFGDIRKGDLVFFGRKGSVRNIGHVGIVVSVEEERGSFTFIHASVSRGVTEDSSNSAYFMMRYMGARRVLPE